jgi:hypothetical protein
MAAALLRVAVAGCQLWKYTSATAAMFMMAAPFRGFAEFRGPDDATVTLRIWLLSRGNFSDSLAISLLAVR